MQWYTPRLYVYTTNETPFTRTVPNSSPTLQALARPHPSDPWSIATAPQDYIAAARPDGDLKGKRILHSATLGNRFVAKDVAAAYQAALARFADAGAVLIELTGELPDMDPIWKVINHTTWRARFADMILRDGERMTPSLVRQVAMAEQWSGADYQRAMFQRADLFRMVQKW